jgi:hypothetical protein
MSIPTKRQYNKTIAHGILLHSKSIAEATGVSSNDLVHLCLHKVVKDGITYLAEIKADDKVKDKFLDTVEQEIFKETGVNAKVLINRPKPNRFSGDCYINAYNEWKQTGNEPVIGWEASILGRYMSIVPHAFNVDKDGNHYDTACDYMVKGDQPRPCWVRCSGKEAKDWLTKFSKYWRYSDEKIMKSMPFWTEVWGGVNVTLFTDNKAYFTRCYGLNKDNVQKNYKYYKTIDCSV